MQITERIMAAVPANLAQGLNATSTLTVSEPGALDLSRLVMGSTYTQDVGPPNYVDYDATGATFCSSLLWNGAQQLIRGRNAPQAPGGAFSALRNGPVIPLGSFAGQSSDTLALQLTMPANTVGAAGGATTFSFVTPIQPQNRRQGYTGILPKQVAYAGSAVQAIVGGGAGNIVFTADSDMVVDLASMVVSVIPDMNATAAFSANFDAASLAGITQITLATGERLVLGQGAVAVPGTLFSAKRQADWVRLGLEQVQGGSQITVAIQNLGANQANFSVGFICYPRNGESGC